jgi:hypothetical protein
MIKNTKKSNSIHTWAKESRTRKRDKSAVFVPSFWMVWTVDQDLLIELLLERTAINFIPRAVVDMTGGVNILNATIGGKNSDFYINWRSI